MTKMNKNETIKFLEGLLFLAGDGVSIDDIVGHFDLTEKDINDAIDALAKKYNDACGINVVRYKRKVQFSTNPALADQISEILNPIRERSLTKAALETVAIIAYKQPITRTEIEHIRGVNSDYAIDLLESNNLIEVVGRKDAIGKPLLFGTTDKFLKRFGLTQISDLPNYETLLERIQVVNSGDGLYRDYDVQMTDLTAEQMLPHQEDNSKMEESIAKLESAKIDVGKLPTRATSGSVQNESMDGDELPPEQDVVTETVGVAIVEE